MSEMQWQDIEAPDWEAWHKALSEMREMRERALGITYDMLLRDTEDLNRSAPPQ
jgi:hypothetical protein